MGFRKRVRLLRVALLCVLGSGCTNYKADMDATRTIWSVHVTTSAADVKGCRLIRHVDSRDQDLGCGLTVQPTPEECLRYQVKRAGGDTLLMRGPAGEAYDCGTGQAPEVAEKASAPTTAPVAAATPVAAAAAAPAPVTAPVPTAAPAPEPTPASPAPAPAPATTVAAEPKAASSVRATSDRSAARGCVYLGETVWSAACGDADASASGPCAEEAMRLGGNLVVRDGARAQVFSCPAKP